MKLHLLLDNDDVHWNPKKFMSYNASTCIAIGGRGNGKTTGAFIQAGKELISKDAQFAYIRRYKPELKTFINKKTLDNVIEGVRYIGDGSGGYTVKVEDKVIGHLIAMAVADNYKSASFPMVKNIILDEATLKPKGAHHYLYGEVFDFLNLVSTITRTRRDYHIYILGNNLDLYNPYFEYFNVPKFDWIYYNKERRLYCELCKNNPKLVEEQKETPLYSLTKGTAFHSFHYDNKVWNKDNRFIIVPSKPNDYNLYCRIIVYNDTINLYISTKGKISIWCELKENKTIKDTISYELLSSYSHNYYDIKLFRNKLRDFISKVISEGRITFANEQCGNIFFRMWQSV